MLLANIVLLYAYGCEPKTTSLIDPALQVTHSQLELEFKILAAKHQEAISDLEKKQEIRNLFFQQALLTTQTGSINPAGVITSLLAIMGIGVGLDDIRVRKKLKNNLEYGPPTNDGPD